MNETAEAVQKKEIWVLVAHEFRLPIIVERYGSQNFVRVMLHPISRSLKCWQEAATAMLINIEFSEHEQAYYIFTEWLNRLAVKVDTEDIESLVMWNPQRPAIGLPAGEMKDMSARRIKRATEIREFLQWFVDSSGIKLFERIEELESFYYMLMGSGLLYMLETGKAMPLTFARVFAAPTKPGWQKEAHKMPKGCNFRTKGGERIAQTVYAGANRPFDKDDKIEWLRPEIICDEAWKATWLANEKYYQAGHTDAAYVRMCDQRIKKVMPLLAEAYQVYRREKALSDWATSRPDVIIRSRDGKSFRQHRTTQQIAAAKVEWARRLAGHRDKKQPSVKDPVAAKNEHLRQMPDILKTASHVWDEDADLEPDYWK